MRYLNNTVIACLLMSSAFLVSCGDNANSSRSNGLSLSDVRNEFKEIIKKFDSKKEDVANEFKEGQKVLLTFKDAVQKAKDKDKAFAVVYDKWTDIKKENKLLRTKFKDLVEGADKFFTTLEAKSNSIKDSRMKLNSLEKVQAQKASYIKVLKATRVKLGMLDSAYDKVKDTLTALEVGYTLNVLEDELDKTLKDINNKISNVMKDLDGLLKQSHKILIEGS